MALIKCSECGKDVSDRAAACPHCGNPLHGRGETTPASAPVVQGDAAVDRENRFKERRMIVVLSVMAVGLFWYAFGYESRHGIGPRPDAGTTPPTPPPSDKLTAAVRFTGTQVNVTNNDAFTWSHCTLEINGGLVRGGYELDAAQIAAQATYAVGAMQFAKESGERFNPLTMKLNRFSIACDTPSGRRYYFGER